MTVDMESVLINKKKYVFTVMILKPDTFVPGQYFRINEFSGVLNRPLVRTQKFVPAFFVRTSEISGLSEPVLKNHHCIL